MEGTTTPEEIKHEAVHSAPAETHAHRKAMNISLENKYIFAVIVVAIMIVLVYLRTGLLQYQGLFEPDGFFYFTALKQLVAQGYPLVTPSTQVLLSSYPWHYRLNEGIGLMYFTLIPYFFLRFFGISLLTVMQLVPIGFGILEVIVAYFLVKHLANSRALGLLAMFFIAASSGNVARTAGAVYRGDTFVTLFVMLALLLMLMILREKNDKRRYAYLIIVTVLVGSSMLVWNGGVIVPALFFLSAGVVAVYGFVAADKRALENCVLLLMATLIGWVINLFWLSIGMVNGNLFATTSFFGIFIPVMVGTLIAKYLIDKRHSFKSNSIFTAITGSLSRRVIVLVAVAVVIGLLALIVFSSYINALLTNGGSIYVQNSNIANTTQELQPPTYAFLWASFSLQLFLAPIGVLLYLLLAHTAADTHHVKRGRLRVNMGYGFVVLFVYLAVAAYLQGGAIRYNSVLSVPLALFSAYAVYIIYKAISGYSMVLRGTEIKFAYIYCGFVIALLLLQVSFTQAQTMASVQADGINPLFLQAMTWVSQNTPKNATFDDLWPDGSVVEGWGNRTSFQDSVGGENGTRIVAFGQYMFNTGTDSQYLINKAFKPQYILVRYFWYDELGGIAEEANLTQNLTLYGYQAMTGFNIAGNSTQQIYEFSSPSYGVQLIIRPQANGTRSMVALIAPLGTNATRQLANILFINSSTDDYSIITTNSPSALNFTLLVTFSGRNITGAALAGQELSYSNMFRFLEECGYNECNYGDANVSAQLVYANADSKIIKLTYT